MSKYTNRPNSLRVRAQRGGSLPDLQDPSEGGQNASHVRLARRLDPGAEPMLGHGTDLVDHRYGIPVLTRYRYRDGRMGVGRRRKRNNDHRRAQTIQRVRAQDKTGASFADLRSLRWVKTDPPNVTALRDDGVASDRQGRRRNFATP